MVDRTGGYRSKTRYKLQKRPRDRGKVKVTSILREFKVGDKVLIMIDSAIHNGMPHPKYKGKEGVITRKQGGAYVVAIKDMNATKELISAAVHLREV